MTGPRLAVAGWGTAAEELAAFEGIRLGDEAAFRAFAGRLDPTLRRLAALYVDTADGADDLVRRTWEIALGAHELFRWRTPLASWVAGFTVTTGRTVRSRSAASAVAAPVASRRPRPASSGPPHRTDWSDLPWSARWEGVGTVLSAAIAELPTAEREVLHGTHVERWPAGRVRDVFGRPEAAAARLLDGAVARLHDAVARHVGETPARDDGEQLRALVRWLRERPVPASASLPGPPVTTFRAWAAGRGRRWPARGPRPRASARAGRRAARASATAPAPPTPT